MTGEKSVCLCNVYNSIYLECLVLYHDVLQIFDLCAPSNCLIEHESRDISGYTVPTVGYGAWPTCLAHERHMLITCQSS